MEQKTMPSIKAEHRRRWAPLDRLKNAVKKIKVLLNFDLHVRRLASAGSLLAAGSSSSTFFRGISFGGAEDRPGLTTATSTDSSDSECCWYSPRGDFASPTTSLKSGIRRTISRGFSMEDDVDKRAEMFIVNFRRQLQIERQISLELMYCLEKT